MYLLHLHPARVFQALDSSFAFGKFGSITYSFLLDQYLMTEMLLLHQSIRNMLVQKISRKLANL